MLTWYVQKDTCIFSVPAHHFVSAIDYNKKADMNVWRDTQILKIHEKTSFVRSILQLTYTTICVVVCTFNRCLSCSLNQFINSTEETAGRKVQLEVTNPPTSRNHSHLCKKVSHKVKNIFRPGIEPEAPAWKANMLPLHHRNRWLYEDISYSL